MWVNKMCFLFVLPACNLCRTPPKYGALCKKCRNQKEGWPRYGQHSSCHWYLFFGYSLFDILYLSIRSFLLPTNCTMLTGILKRKPAICSGDSGTFGYSTSISYFKHNINSSLLYCFYLNNHIECNIAMFSILHFHNIDVYLFKKSTIIRCVWQYNLCQMHLDDSAFQINCLILNFSGISLYLLDKKCNFYV